ncbi:rhomboid family intramembrane serine protease [Corynebacterium sp. UBA2622]|uniref:rhomboid family intramembrane serine protease n=1 Tax=Corynebacterium sp. UBA2622 TaxID=1946393 RepID=UPI0025BCDDBE|nr:rhomboid family intramembrane serine protease [Corynebacterium sp. UBA2622]
MNIRKLFSHTPATAVVCVACLAVFVVSALQARSLGNTIGHSRLGADMVLYGPFAASEPLGWTRALTAGFAHLDVTHISVNLLMLALVGTEVERFVGTGPFALAYAGGLLGSSAAVLTMNFTTPTVGASGALYMLMALLAAIAYRRHTDLRAPFAFVALNLLYSVITPQVSLWGHVGGLLTGMVVAWPLTHPDTRIRWAGAALGVGLGAAAVALPLR